MINAIYRIAFTGTSGSGLGILLLSDGVIAGADVSGVLYDGTFKEETSTNVITAEVMMRAPAGVALVQTGIPLAEPTSLPLSLRLPPDFDRGDLVRLETPLGPVNVVFTRIRDAIREEETMAIVFIEARPKGRPEGSAIQDYVVEDHAEHELGTFKTQQDAIDWAKARGHTPHVARVRHLNDKKKPDLWRAV